VNLYTESEAVVLTSVIVVVLQWFCT